MKSKFDELISCFNRKVSGMEIEKIKIYVEGVRPID